MGRYFSRFGIGGTKLLFLVLLVSLVFVVHRFWHDEPPREELPLLPSISFNLSSIRRTHDFRLYPQSRSAMEYARLQLEQTELSMFSVPNGSPDSNIDPSKPLLYSESSFRSAAFPVIWLDEHGDVRWNRRAQIELLDDLLEKQFPSMKISECLTRQLFVLSQWSMGFFSRHHCLIEHFGQTLYSPSMVLLAPVAFVVSNSAREDFRNEGILRYYQSISLCSAYLDHPALVTLREQLPKIGYTSSNTKIVTQIQQLLERDESTVKYKYSREIWRFGYEHVPHRRWLFDRQRADIRKRVDYRSPIPTLINHSNEHIYYYNGSLLKLTQWTPRNSPQGSPTDVLAGTSTNLSLNDRIFTSFLRYMFLLFLSPLAPRIQTSTKLLAHHWSEYLADKQHKPYEQSLSLMAVIFIRRGDKAPEDSFWNKHQRWRNISMYVKGMVDEEKRRQVTYTSVFVMTDDLSVMSSIQEYARDGLTTGHRDESYAREHLHGREILYNVFAPQSCFDPFIRIGFDQFLVNVQFVTDYASLVVGHTDSNVGRYLEEMIYVKRQHQKDVQTFTHVINAPDSLD